MSVNEEIRASAAAHRDLGPGYEGAVAEGLVERIGEEIDRRIDARLYGHTRSAPPLPPQVFPQQQPPPRRQSTSGVGFWGVVLGLGSMGLAVGGTAVVLHPGWQGTDNGLAPLVVLIWLVVGVINVAYARRR